MERLVLFIYQYRAFFIFVILEFFCSWLIVQNNQYQGAQFFNSSNAFVANLSDFSQGVKEYFSLRETNQLLAENNADLRKKLEQLNQRSPVPTTQTNAAPEIVNRFDFVSAKVVNNSVHRFTNYITINKGRDKGIEPGMAVISPTTGIVGKVKVVSKHYGVITSLLNIDVMVSALLKRTSNFGTVQWDGYDPDIVKLKFIPRHVKPVVGDTVVTSGYNAVFPEGIVIGLISDVTLSEEAPFYDIDVKLSQDFRRLTYVVVVKSNLMYEQDSLEQSFNKPD